MAARWFRFYEDVMDDPKVQLLSDAHYRAWTVCLCLASKFDGEIPGDEPTLCFALRKSAGKVRDTLQALLSAGLIDRTETGYTPHNWSGRQFKSDDSKERVKRHREKKNDRDSNGQRNGDVTANVTPPETETETETETEEDTSLRSVSPPQAADPKPTRARSKPSSKPEPPGFTEFYAEYPLHKARPAAAKAFAAALSRASPDVLLAGARRYAASRRDEAPKFTKHPATWLNQDCWLDEDTTNDNRPQIRTKNGDFLSGMFAAVEQVHDEARPGEGPDDSGGFGETRLALPSA